MKSALLVIDVQMALAMDDAAGAERSCPQASSNIATLLKQFRERGDNVVHIHHHGTEADDPFFENGEGAKVQPVAAPTDDESVIVKYGSSGFIGTTLEADLREAGVERVFLCGATANHCVESTTRMAGNLGLDPHYVSDAVWAYAAEGPDGQVHSAEQIHSVSLANLQGEFAVVLPTAEALAL